MNALRTGDSLEADFLSGNEKKKEKCLFQTGGELLISKLFLNSFVEQLWFFNKLQL